MTILFRFYKKNISFIKYGLVSILAYILIIMSIYVLVDILKFNSIISYSFVYLIMYVYTYFANIRYVFNVEHNNKKVVNFLLFTFVFWFISTSTYTLLIKLSIHHLVAALVNAIILMPVRYYVNKNFVYR